MSAVPAIDRSERFPILKPPFNDWSAEDVLNYFKTRDNVRYFPVADPGQVSPEKIDNILSNRFEFNGESYRLEKNFDWRINPSPDIEWLIMQHKFYYAVGLGLAFSETGDCRYAEKWMELTSGWIASVPVDFLSSDVIGRRLQNWIFAHFYFVAQDSSASISADFYRQFLTSLHQQCHYLIRHLTPARNHRTLELYTIFLTAVVFPEFTEADGWLEFAKAELLKNVQSDFLPDGVHCELSTDYHHIVLRNLLGIKKLALLNHILLPAEMDDAIKKALEFSVHAHKPDGMIPSLSDGDTANFLDLLRQGHELYGCETMRYVASQGVSGTAPAQRCKAFPDGGYYVLHSGWGEQEDYRDERYLIFDCGPLGAGNHGHLDLLSFEMAAYGQSLIVDPGRYTYDESGETNWRVIFRGTGFHNTVRVDGKNQARYEFFHEKFKIRGPAPNYELKAFTSVPGLDYVYGIARSHEYPVLHERKIVFVNSEYWLICDVLTAAEPHDYDLLFHLSALAQNKLAVVTDENGLQIHSPHLIVAQPVSPSISLALDSGFVSPVYGVKHPAPIIRFSQRAAKCCFYTVLYPFKTARPSLSVTQLPVYVGHDLCPDSEAGCLVITRNNSGASNKDFLFVGHTDDGKERRFNRHATVSPIFLVREDNTGQNVLRAEIGAHYR